MYKLVIAITILIVVFIMFLFKLRKQTISELNKVLLIDNNPKLYLELLNNKRLNLLFEKASIEHLRLKAYLILNDEKLIEDSFDKLDQMKLSKGERVEYNTLKLSYYAKKVNAEKSKEALEELEILLDNARTEESKEILKDAKIIYEVYVAKNNTVHKELQKLSKEQNGLKKGITLFRLAKLSNYQGNNDSVNKYLNEALKYSKGSTYELIIEECLKDNSKLNEY
ncbi:MAG: hypothetical protein Q4B60_00045 [Erysipelotrichaceae bacterium]|nr:hypothetical protein [Erysipelotrichaceae bacterium]